ncbi:acyltransferase [Mesorhizobium sp. AR10]|uniref:acyltransferase family protein n=1 Tax=Mesorhizobium sp. AR10 TaxID=2865839 RepID=UPI00215F0B36|nr:acyltransferase family protein [Mesorhizobium sp. AR10]UVK40148.1 acyltransferase [Mesorhizobium sp. AR10]
MIKYRADIDGLRAVAVLPVVLFHAGFPLFGGGYVGVDVFFVISGYLITKIIVDDIEQHKYSVASFYERRIRRIIPAYLATVVVTMVVALVFMLPEDLEDFGGSALWSALMSSNVFFWIESNDYFNGAAELKPLLHTWSLSVEEQFYVLFPIGLLVVYRLGLWRYAAALCLLAAVASLGLAAYGVRQTPMAAFYLLPTRAWELLVGSLLAFELVPAPRRRVAGWESFAGLGLILAPVISYTAETPFPGIMALPPVLGAALIIHSGLGQSTAPFTELLSNPLLRFVGLISYSLYLWHWPIVVFMRYYYIELSFYQRIFIVAFSIAIAFLSWRFIERPGRRRDGTLRRPQLFLATATSMALLAAAGWAARESLGFPSRVPKDIQILASKRAHQGPWRECGYVYRDRRDIDTLCVRGAAHQSPDFVIIGDSHANAVAAAIFQNAAEVGRAGYQISDTGYRPLLDFGKWGEEKKYQYMNRLTTDFFDARPGVKSVIVPIYWRQAALVDRYYNSNRKIVDGITAMREGLFTLVERYPEKQFLFVLSTANSDLFGANPAARAAWYGHAFNPVVHMAEFRRITAAYGGIVDDLRALPNVQFLDISSRVCDVKVCHGFIEGKLAFTDDNHISFQAAMLFSPEIRGFLGGSTQRTIEGDLLERRAQGHL